MYESSINVASDKEIIFLLDDITDYQTLARHFGERAEVVVLDTNIEVLEQIAAHLSGRSNLQAIHLVTHGASGALQLGALQLTAEELPRHAGTLARIGQALSDDGDMLLYGCDVAQGEKGHGFLAELARLTRADLAASTDVTGAPELGGDWQLEWTSGPVESVALDAADWQGTLPMTTTPNTVLFSNHSMGEWRNGYAFAAVKNDGAVVSWGAAAFGGDSSSVAAQLTQVKQIYSSNGAFAALNKDGSVVAWGHADYGGSIASDKAVLLSSGVKQIYSTLSAFAALKEDGTVVAWGSSLTGGDPDTGVLGNLTNVKAIYTTDSAFTALKNDGTVVVWGNSFNGGNPDTSVLGNLTDVSGIYSNFYAFSALKNDGSVVTWGDNASSPLPDTAAESALTSGVQEIYSTLQAFAALKGGTVVTWGNSSFGGDSSSVAMSLTDVQKIFATERAFAALKNDGTVVTWGDSSLGGDSSGVAASLTDVQTIYANSGAFAAVKTDGTVVTWGSSTGGGDSSGVAASLTGVQEMSGALDAFAALKDDGTVVTWGSSISGGDSSGVAGLLTNVQKIYANYGAFAALKSDGTVVTWGGSGGDSSSVASQLTDIAGIADIRTDDVLSYPNEAPQFANDTTLTPIDEDVPSLDHEDVSDPGNPPPNQGTDIADLIAASGFSDADSNACIGIAISADAATEGKWQYSTDANSEYWHDIGTVSGSQALLLQTGGSSPTYIRFVPVANYNGTPGGLTVHAIDATGEPTLQFTTWDGTNEDRHTFDTTADDDTSPVSATAVSWGITIASVNDAPVITSDGGGATATFDAVAGSTTATTVTVSDVENDTISYSISGGNDAGLFTIDSDTGVLSFITAPDAADNNSYAVTVAAADGQGGTDTQDLTITVHSDIDGDGTIDINDTDIDGDGGPNTQEDLVPDPSGSGTGDGNGDGTRDAEQIHIASLPTVGTGTPYATLEVANGLTLTNVINGAVSGLPRNIKMPVGQFDFTIGNVTPGGAVDVSVYVDSSLNVNSYYKKDGTDNWHNITKSSSTVGSKTKITFSLTDGGPYDSDSTINGIIVDAGIAAHAAPLITSNGGDPTSNINVTEGSGTVTTVTASAIAPVSYSISGGADAALFNINQSTGVLSFITAPDYESPQDKGGTAADNSYVIAVSATDLYGSDEQTLTINVTDVDENVTEVDENVTDVDETPASVIITVDGVQVETRTATIEGDISVTVTEVAPINNGNRSEDKNTGNVALADIPILFSDTQKTSAVTTVSLPDGIGLRAQGGAAPLSRSDALKQLISLITSTSDQRQESDKSKLIHGGQAFLDKLSGSDKVLVHEITLTTSNHSAPAQPIIISGSATNGDATETLVIDASQLPAGTVINLKNVEFAVIIGSAIITGGDGSNMVFAGTGDQTLILGEDDDELHGGDGNDTVGSEGGNDRIFGEEGNDVVFGGQGNDEIDGGSGMDTVRLAGGSRSDYTMRVENGKLVMTHRDGGDGTDTVANVEILRFTDGKGDMSAGSVVTRLYEGLLARSPDAAGFKFWVSAVEHGISLEQVAESMLDSDEATQLHSTVTNAAYVSQFYRNVLQRDADPEGHAFWTRAIDDGKLTRGGAALAIANSHESLARPHAFDVDFNTTDVATIVRLYDSLLARKPDADGLNFWIGASEAGVSMADIADSFIHSAESVRIYSSMSNAEFVNALYETALDRQPGGNEADGWIGSLDRGQLDRGDVLLGFANSPEKIGLVGMQSTSIEII